ncbi:MAG: hypothetical protein HUU20_20920 [Pirellulales bacterium]|nr:hypothetical protein [Pirellulales bacterium]
MTRSLLRFCGLVCQLLVRFSTAWADEPGAVRPPKHPATAETQGADPTPPVGSDWRCVMTLDDRRQLIAGDPNELRTAIARGADLRIYSEFIHNEHIDPKSTSAEPVQESMDMRCTYWIDRRWVAGLLTLRQPVDLPLGFGPRPSLSLFLYNENGEQAIARPFLDGPPKIAPHGPCPVSPPADMPKYHEFDSWDAGTNAPSSNFAYDFGKLKYFVRDDWREVLAHDSDGKVQRGSMADLIAAFRRGAEFKVGMADLCEDLSKPAGPVLPHEVFIQCGSVYLYTQQPLFIAATHPLVRVAPAVPLRYASENWDYSWLVVRTDGRAALLHYNPYTLTPVRTERKLALRWFAR